MRHIAKGQRGYAPLPQCMLGRFDHFSAQRGTWYGLSCFGFTRKVLCEVRTPFPCFDLMQIREFQRWEVVTRVSVMNSTMLFCSRYAPCKFGWALGSSVRFFQKNSRTEYFGSRLFRFGFGSNRTNRIFLPKAKITRKIYMFYSKFRQYFLYFRE